MKAKPDTYAVCLTYRVIMWNAMIILCLRECSLKDRQSIASSRLRDCQSLKRLSSTWPVFLQQSSAVLRVAVHGAQVCGQQDNMPQTSKHQHNELAIITQ